MIQKDLIKRVEQTYKKATDLIKSKNSDYSDPEKDVFKNFRSSGLVGVNPKRAILVRVCDKISRISNLLDRPNQVKSEPIFNDLEDSINYLCLLKVWIESGEE